MIIDTSWILMAYSMVFTLRQSGFSDSLAICFFPRGEADTGRYSFHQYYIYLSYCLFTVHSCIIFLYRWVMFETQCANQSSFITYLLPFFSVFSWLKHVQYHHNDNIPMNSSSSARINWCILVYEPILITDFGWCGVINLFPNKPILLICFSWPEQTLWQSHMAIEDLLFPDHFPMERYIYIIILNYIKSY